MVKGKIHDEGVKPTSSRTLGIIIGTLIFFAILFIIFFSVKNLQEKPKTLEELHAENLNKGPSDTNYMYDGFSFIKLDDIWYTQVKNPEINTVYNLALRFGPKELENVSINGDYLEFIVRLWETNSTTDIALHEAYFLIDPEDYPRKYINLAYAELFANLLKTHGLNLVVACTKNITSDCFDKPILSCDSTDEPVFYMDLTAEDASVDIYNNCCIISGKEWELVRAAEKLLYRMYGIMK